MALAFITEQLIFVAEQHVRSSDLMEELNRWLADKRMNPWNAKTVATRLGGHDEFRRHGVVNKTVKASDKRSEPAREPNLFDLPKPVPSTYKAWVGVRFRAPADEVEEALEAGFQDPVTAVTADPVNARENPSREVIQASGNSGNHAAQGGSGPVPASIPGCPSAAENQGLDADQHFSRHREKTGKRGGTYVPPGRRSSPPTA